MNVIACKQIISIANCDCRHHYVDQLHESEEKQKFLYGIAPRFCKYKRIKRPSVTERVYFIGECKICTLSVQKKTKLFFFTSVETKTTTEALESLKMLVFNKKNATHSSMLLHTRYNKIKPRSILTK